MVPSGSGFSTPLALGGFIVLFAVAGLLVLWYDDPTHTAWRTTVRRWAGRLTGREDLSWVDAPLLAGIAAAAFALGGGVTWWLGDYGCSPGGGPSDLLTVLTSGREFLHGGNPFTITACGHGGNPVPAGLASVLLEAVGSAGGTGGILLVWGAVSVGVIPLVWELSGRSRAVATVFVLTSFLYLPIVAAQIDGATLALVPVAVLLTLYLARSGWTRASAVGGFLATGRFPALFPILGATGRAGRHRGVAFAAAAGTFAAVSVATYAVYGSEFTGPVFLLQFTRSHLALNYWGLLEGTGWLAPSHDVTVVQAALTLVLVAVCWARARSDLGAVAIVLTGTVLLAQFLSYTELVFLIPVAMVSGRTRWWLWATGVVGSTNYLLALRSLAGVGGYLRLSYGLDLALTALLLGLLVDLVRSELLGGPGGPARDPAPAPGAPREPAGGRSIR